MRQPEKLVGTVWERRWIVRNGGAKDSSIVVRYVSAAYACIDVRVPRPFDVSTAAGFAGVTSISEDGVLRWHECLNLNPPVKDPKAAWEAAEAGKPLPTEDAGTCEWISEGVWHEHGWPDPKAYTEEWALIDSGSSFAALKGSTECLVVVGKNFGYCCPPTYCVGRVCDEAGLVIEYASSGPQRAGSRLYISGLEGWRTLPESDDELFAMALKSADVKADDASDFKPFIATDPPLELVTEDLFLEPLGPHHVDADLEAVLDGMSDGTNRLCHVFQRNDNWPSEDISREEDLHDLNRHAAEFKHRLAFAYTVLDKKERSKVLGCCYINPATKVGYEAECILWIRASADRALDAQLEEALRKWLSSSEWPFENVVFPGRDCGDEESDRWAYFESLPQSKKIVPRIAFDAETIVLHRPTASGLIP